MQKNTGEKEEYSGLAENTAAGVKRVGQLFGEGGLDRPSLPKGNSGTHNIVTETLVHSSNYHCCW